VAVAVGRDERRAKATVWEGSLEGWSRDRVVDEIVRGVPGVSALEAHRIAWGWTRKQASLAIDHHYERDGLLGPRVMASEICGWEHGRHLPNAERQDYLCRVYHTRPDRLGFGRDHTRPAGGGVEASAGPPSGCRLSIAAGPVDRIVTMAWRESGGAPGLVVEVEDGDGDGRALLTLTGSIVEALRAAGAAPTGPGCQAPTS
jgi:hypothetical protein